MDQLFTTQGITRLLVVTVVGLVVAVALVRSQRASLYVLAALLFFNALGLSEDFEKGVQTWLAPLQVANRWLVAASAGLLYLGAFAHKGKLDTKTLPGLGLGMMAMGVYMGLISIYHENAISGMTSIFFAIFSMIAIFLALGSTVKTWDDCTAVMRAFMLAGGAWTLGSVVQFFVNQNFLVMGNSRRFIGLMSNPQHAAGFCAVMATLCVWLVLNDRVKFYRVLAMFVGATHIVFVLWTSSRTGLAVTIIGFTAVFYARMGRAVLFAPVIAAVGYGLLSAAASMGVRFGFERLTSTDDTRTHMWRRMWDSAMESPIVGVGLRDATGSENGFLYGFSLYGIGMPIIMLLLMFSTIFVCAKLFHARFLTKDPVGKRVIDLTIGFFAMYWAGNMFEGYGVARISPQLVFFLTFSCIATAAMAIVRAEQAEGLTDESEFEPVDGYGEYTHELPT